MTSAPSESAQNLPSSATATPPGSETAPATPESDRSASKRETLPQPQTEYDPSSPCHSACSPSCLPQSAEYPAARPLAKHPDHARPRAPQSCRSHPETQFRNSPPGQSPCASPDPYRSAAALLPGSNTQRPHSPSSSASSFAPRRCSAACP